MLNIFDITVNKGEKKSGKIPVGYLAHGAEVHIPVLILRGEEDGPTFWINGAVHGDELNGPVAAWEIYNELSPSDIKGTLVITPLSNPLAYEDRDKISKIDFLDMDTTFPGDPEGLFTQRLAYTIFTQIEKHADFVLNFHTLHTHYQAVAYTVSKIVPGAKEEIVNKSREMALAFGTKTNCVVDLATATGELPGVTSGALDITCMHKGIPAFMAEVGSGGKIDREFVDVGKVGIRNVMIYLNMLEGTLKRPESQYVITKRKFLRADHGGLITMKVQPGEIASLGQALVETHNFGDQIHTTSLKHDAYLIATRENPVVNTGDRLAFVGLEWHEVKNE